MDQSRTYKVAKFGGSSVATGESIKKVAGIIRYDITRKYIVVSAPGKRISDDTKVTEMLFDAATQAYNNKPYQKLALNIVERFREIVIDLRLNKQIAEDIQSRLFASLEGKCFSNTNLKNESYEKFAANVVYLGEYYSAKILTLYLQSKNVSAVLVEPFSTGLILEGDNFLEAEISSETYEKLSGLDRPDTIYIFPGYYGFNQAGEVMCLGRDGSDLTGAVIAYAYRKLVGVYEIFTDTDGLYSANPSIVDSPSLIREISYEQVREYSYYGCKALYHKVVNVLMGSGIVTNIRNTFNPTNLGTWVLDEIKDDGEVIKGIASKPDFFILNIHKAGMNEQTGFVDDITQILKKEGIPFDFTPCSIDNITFYIQCSNLENTHKNNLESKIRSLDDEISVSIESNISLITLVGDGFQGFPYSLVTVFTVFCQKFVELKMISYTHFSQSIIFGVDTEDEHKAVNALYEQYFR